MTVIGGVVTILTVIAPLTKATWDDKILLSFKGLWNSIKIDKTNKTVLLQIKEK